MGGIVTSPKLIEVLEELRFRLNCLANSCVKAASTAVHAINVNACSAENVWGVCVRFGGSVGLRAGGICDCIG